MRRYCLSIAVFLAGMPGFCQQIPQTRFTTLTGAHVVIPQQSSAKPLLLLVGFSHKASGDLSAWNKRFKVTYETDPRVEYYELADFEGVPGFVMKLIRHGMRRSMKEPERSHVAPFYEHGKDWQSLVEYQESAVVYLVLADGGGHVLWQTKGPANDAKAAELESHVAKLSNTQ